MSMRLRLFLVTLAAIIAAALWSSGCATSAPTQRGARSVAHGGHAHVEALYLPRTTHISVRECLKRFHSKSYCEWHGGADISEECSIGYHMEHQWATGGFGAALIPTSRLVCHRDDLRGVATAKGLECLSR